MCCWTGSSKKNSSCDETRGTGKGKNHFLLDGPNRRTIVWCVPRCPFVSADRNAGERSALLGAKQVASKLDLSAPAMDARSPLVR